MQTVSGKRDAADAESRFKELRTRIENESSAVYSTARLWVCLISAPGAAADVQDDGIIAPSDTRDMLGMGLELAAEERASREAEGVSGGQRGEIGADGDAGGWGVFRM